MIDERIQKLMDKGFNQVAVLIKMPKGITAMEAVPDIVVSYASKVTEYVAAKVTREQFEKLKTRAVDIFLDQEFKIPEKDIEGAV